VSTPGGDDSLPPDGWRPAGLAGVDEAAGSAWTARDPRPHVARQQPMVTGFASALVRPYAVTGGRTKPRYQLQIEAMVAACHFDARDPSALSPECHAILRFCRDWRSVAEISAVLRMPLGVARVIVADMAVDELVRVHQTDHAEGRPDLNLLERVLSGLRKL
jgi:hypothetical protein